MLFEEALKAMREGKKIKRGSDSCKLFLKDGWIYWEDGQWIWKCANSEWELEDILCEDWEIAND